MMPGKSETCPWLILTIPTTTLQKMLDMLDSASRMLVRWCFHRDFQVSNSSIRFGGCYVLVNSFVSLFPNSQNTVAPTKGGLATRQMNVNEQFSHYVWPISPLVAGPHLGWEPASQHGMMGKFMGHPCIWWSKDVKNYGFRWISSAKPIHWENRYLCSFTPYFLRAPCRTDSLMPAKPIHLLYGYPDSPGRQRRRTDASSPWALRALGVLSWNLRSGKATGAMAGWGGIRSRPKKGGKILQNRGFNMLQYAFWCFLSLFFWRFRGKYGKWWQTMGFWRSKCSWKPQLMLHSQFGTTSTGTLNCIFARCPIKKMSLGPSNVEICQVLLNLHWEQHLNTPILQRILCARAQVGLHGRPEHERGNRCSTDAFFCWKLCAAWTSTVPLNFWSNPDETGLMSLVRDPEAQWYFAHLCSEAGTLKILQGNQRFGGTNMYKPWFTTYIHMITYIYIYIIVLYCIVLYCIVLYWYWYWYLYL